VTSAAAADVEHPHARVNEPQVGLEPGAGDAPAGDR
jgi:hypothetical protein